MDTAEVPVPHPSFRRRLRSGALLLLIGGAAHLWLVPYQQSTEHAGVWQAAATTPQQRPAGVAGAVGTAGAALQQTIDKIAGAVVSEASAADTTGAAEHRPVRLVVRRVAPAAVFVDSPPRPATPPPGNVRGASHVAGALRAAASSSPTEPASIESPSPVSGGDLAPTASASAPASDNGGGEGARESRPEPAPLGDVVPAVLPVSLTNMPGRTIAALPAMVTAPATPRLERAAAREELLGAADEALVRQALQDYRVAYERLDVAAARNVWPTVDTRALSSAFRQLVGQRLTFESCGISVAGAAANARCRGQAEYLPKVGSRRAYLASGEWVFDLAKHDADWRIVNARVR